MNRREARKCTAKLSWLRRNLDDFQLLYPDPVGTPRAPAYHENVPCSMTQYDSPTNSLNEISEPHLVGDARNGNREAMAELFRRHYPPSIAVSARDVTARHAAPGFLGAFVARRRGVSFDNSLSGVSASREGEWRYTTEYSGRREGAPMSSATTAQQKQVEAPELKNGSKLTDTMSGAYRQLLGSPPAGGLGQLLFRFPPTGIGVVFPRGLAECFGLVT
jgi:hypothetical protein